MKTNNKFGAAECGDCNTCGKCDELEQSQETQNSNSPKNVDVQFNDAVLAAAAVERNSFEKNLARQRRATFAQDSAQGIQKETFSRNAVARPTVPGHEGALLSHDGLTLYTLIIYSENFAGILNQITAVFTRRQVNIESLNVCASSTPGVHKYTITCYCKQEMAEMLTRQIEKKIDVLQANCFVDDEIFILETSLLKLSTPMVLANKEISCIVRRFDARFVEVNPTYTIVENTGITTDVIDLFTQLDTIGCVLQFVRTGRIAVTKSCVERLDAYIAKREEERESPNCSKEEKTNH
ncbi:MAG: acetolactate synthase small subunit [Bacteroidaceae bacterium]|jgi:acetolactate synthase-1/3 small subunit|nr:acetolactate synthase small subunit [Bacteroidaceae bacterium]MBQ2292540.1 acetolactate synthase small subunit [Bacteroidaceae bacterium]MBQ2300053.1 acetolactate synthase small subunit [Bacteroidaceae bacterium]MBQ5681208.1 acetolactate synthase small subunit [Bacteroidaceae bacterium]MBQ5714127.1 acetolactate synthase small subunit [Bacteroidaceae bacterium]